MGNVTAGPPTRCARPTLGRRGTSTYTVLGFSGYGVASVVGGTLSAAWGLTLAERLIATVIPPLAFLIVVSANRRILRKERIVFYQTAVAGVAAVALLGMAMGARTERLIDIATIGIGTFLVFGRIGCFSVACCHGRPARYGVVYGPAHVRVGFWTRWAGRPLWPVQLVEAGVSLALVIGGLVVGWNEPGTPTLIYALGYGLVRFLLELRRGDPTRPHALGISEAQWTSAATLIACAIWRPSAITIASASLLVAAIALLASQHKQRELTQAHHLFEIDRACSEVLASKSNDRRETSLGVCISCHRLPDGRRDWVLSGSHPAWSVVVARRIASNLWVTFDFVEGRIAGVAHVVEG
ncbi:MAG TPA: prolipoprotein diacylglyceryl transferase family protein [Kofleriaceae bacterium]|nr:prolipoprotein diacylglyceryl transferase family protein [Kofleriaceae bacterium]